MSLPQVTPKHYAAIFTVALATLATQIVFSRIFSVIFYYHMAFAGITLAMLGLTAGALKVYADPERFGAEKVNEALADSIAFFAAALVVSAIMLVHMPGMLLMLYYNVPGIAFPLVGVCIGISVTLLLVALVESGVCIALLLTRFPAFTGRLYAFDLAGAAFGCIVVVVALMWLDPVSLVMVLGVALSLMAWRLLPKQAEKRLSKKVHTITLTLALACVVQVVSALQGAPVFHLLWAKNMLYSTPVELERWNTYSRVAIMDYQKYVNPEMKPFGWGFGSEHKEPIEQKWINIDADAGTVMTHFNGDLKKVDYLKDDISNLAYSLRDIKSVAVIGVGGGRDILSSQVFGVTHATGIELNPAIYGAITGKYGEFTGHLDKRPGVSLVNAEARSYLNSHHDSYDLVQISLIDTWATTAAGGLTLSESKLYTTDAWKDFFAHLTRKGVLSVSRWYDPDSHPGEFYRLLSIASDVIKSTDPKANPRDHILVARVHNIITMLLSVSPLTQEDIGHFTVACQKLHFTPMVTPLLASDELAGRIASGKTDKAFFDSQSLNLVAPTDDTPFFFHMIRLSSLITGRHGQFGSQNNIAVATLLGLFIFTFVASVFLIARPMANIYITKKIRFAETAPYMLYFACIGLGFMLIEVSQIQRLMIFLGHPVYGLTVVLFILLLASSAGSFTQRNVKAGDTQLWKRQALLCAVLCVTGIVTPYFTEHLKYYDTAIRIVTSGLLMVPMGLCMGMMFPIGIALASTRHADLLPWYWGINGAASVFASVFAVVLSLQFGISATFWVGVACYGLCLLVVARHKPQV